MKLIVNIPEEIVTAIQNGQDYRYDIHTAIAQGKPCDTSDDLISREALLKSVDEEREYLKSRGQLGAEHILVHNFRDLIDNAPTVEPFEPDYVGAERLKARQRGYEEGYHYGMEIGKTLNPKIKQGEWIPVSERLPDKNGNYLCTVDYGEDGVEVTQRFYLDTLSGFEKRYNKNDKVIAWQPLPEPYKEGGAK